MITEEELMNTGVRGRPELKIRPTTQPVMSSEEAQNLMHEGGRSTVMTLCNAKEKVFLITDDYLFGYTVLGDDWVVSRHYMPFNVVARPEFPDGWIHTVSDLIKLSYKEYRQLTSVEQLLSVLNKSK